MEGPEITSAEAVIDNGTFGTRTVRFETGRLAAQAAGSVTAYLDDDTMMLSTTTAGKHPKDHFDFFPLTVDVEERMYAAGKIPGSFFRREGRPSTDAILTCRLIDRPLRPTFVSGLRNEVQVVITVLSLNPDHQYDVVAINAASASTQISGLPFSGPIGATRISLIEGQWVAFPNFSDAERSTFDMVVAGRVVGEEDDGSGNMVPDVAIMMVEAESTEATWDLVNTHGKQAPTEEVVAQGLEASKKFIAALCAAQSELATGAAKETQEFPRFLDYQDDAMEAVEAQVSGDLTSALQIGGKAERETKIDEIKKSMMASMSGSSDAGSGESEGAFAGRDKELSAAYRAVQKKLIRQRILRDKVRIDGRGLADIRALSAEVEVIPRTHGSAIFERGETQIMGVTTLNMLRMEQMLDTLSPVSRKRYMHNYNFPPYSTGETGRVGSPKRREVGHGALAERALMPVLPTREEFPYAIRQVSEALSSNGSTSMGSVCASTMSLWNAGVPLRAPVAGIAMGLVSAEVDGKTEYAALTDILGAEDAFGDMDFKVAGTKEFVTAIQLDTKLDGIPASVLGGALTQARDARLHILDVMLEAIDAPDEMSPFAPRVISVKVPVDKIGEVIGPKGKMIKQIQEDTGADIAIEDDGTVYIGATDGPSAEAARNAVNAIANPTMPEIGERFMGTVVKTTTFGAFISLTPGKDGLLHISEIRKLVGGKRIDAVEDVLSVGQKVQVELNGIDPRGKLSLGAVVAEDTVSSQAAEAAPPPPVAPAADAASAHPSAGEAGLQGAASDGSTETAGSADNSDGNSVSAERTDGSGAGEGGGDRPRRNRRRRGGRGRGNGPAGGGDSAPSGSSGSQND
ncbi:MAG: polyribonucleotide nucleotidyltransferase [Ornithinimicrobium sp.]